MAEVIAPRLRHYVRQDDARSARWTSWLLLAGAFVSMGSVALIIYFLSSKLVYIFIDNSDIRYRVAILAPISAGAQVAMGMQGISRHVLLAIGHFRAEVTGVTVLALWIFGLGTAYFLGYYMRPTYGLEGYWLGLTTGSSLLAVSLTVAVLTLNWSTIIKRTKKNQSEEENESLLLELLHDDEFDDIDDS